MQGTGLQWNSKHSSEKKELANLIMNEGSAALPVHCFAHCFNLCLHGAGRQITILQDALDAVRETSKFVNFSPKSSHLFEEKLKQSEQGGITIKTFFSTRWTVRTAALETIIKDYSIMIKN